MEASDVANWEVPSLWVPFDAAPNWETVAMGKKVGEWIYSTGLCTDPATAMSLGMVGALGTGYGISAATAERAEVFSRYMSWGFYMDDLFDSAGESDETFMKMVRLGTRLIEVVETPSAITPCDDVVVRAWADIARGLHKVAPEPYLRRTLDAFALCILGWIREALMARTDELPSLAGFMRYRQSSGAAAAIECMLELSVAPDVSFAVVDSLACREACELAAFLALLDNELLSRNKESVRSEHETGLVAVLDKEYPGLGQSNSLDTAIALRNRLMAVFAKLIERLMQDRSPEVQTYARTLGNYVAGIAEFLRTCPRYTMGTTPTLRTQADVEAWLPPLPHWITRWEQRVG